MKNILCLFIFFTVSVFALNAQTKQEKVLAAAVETLNKGILKPERSLLENVTSADLSFGHSSGKIENKTEFVDLLVNGFYVYSSLSTSSQTIHIAGKTAVVRHLLTAKLTIGGTPADLNLGALQVWKREHGNWKLLARQGFKM